jgi:hypothetical protein
MKFSIYQKKKGQTIIELCLVLLSLLGFFFLGLFAFSIFEVSQKQTSLTRAQAFMELGNHSSFGRSAHGRDDPKNSNSQVFFQLGKKSEGIFLVDFNRIESFKKAVEGELDLTAGADSDDAFWAKYRLPKQVTRVFGGESRGDLDLVELEIVLAIAHNRSIDLGRENRGRPTGEYSTGVHMRHLNEALAPLLQNALSESYGAQLQNGAGMISNYDETLRVLKDIIREDSSVHRQAAQLENDLNIWRVLSGRMQAFLVSTAIQTALSFGFQAVENLVSSASQAAGSAASGAASGATNAGVSSAGNSLSSFGSFAQGAGKLLTTSSQVLSVAHSASALAGKPIQALATASTVTGGAGSIFTGLSGLESFKVDGGFSGGGKMSEFFNSSGGIMGGSARIFSLVDPSAAQALGIGAQTFGFMGGLSSLEENWGAWSQQAGGGFKQISGVGQSLSQGAGLLSHAAPGSTAVGAIDLLGSGFSTFGGSGTFLTDLGAGRYDGEFFSGLSQTGGFIAQTSGLGMSMASLTGDTSAMTGLAISSIVGGAMVATGAAGNLAKGLIDAAPKLGENISAGVDSVLSGEFLNDFKLVEGGGGFDRAAQAVDMGLQIAMVAKSGAPGGAGFAAGAESLQASLAQTQAAGGATAELDRILAEMDPQQVIAATKMPASEAEQFNRDFLAVQRSVSEVKKSFDKKEAPNEEMLKNAQLAATRLQETLDKYKKEEDKPKQNFNSAEANQRAMDLQRHYQKIQADHLRVIGYMQTSENHLMGKRILAKDPEKKRLLREHGRRVSREIQALRQTQYAEEEGLSGRMKRAEYHWRNLNFVSPKEALHQIQTEFYHHRAQYESLKESFHEKLSACRLQRSC